MGSKNQRCFGTGKEFYEKYHDDEWGIPVHDDRRLFEMLCLEGAQAGLSWETILKRREGYRRSFHQFKPEIVAKMTDSELDEVLKDPAIIYAFMQAVGMVNDHLIKCPCRIKS